MKRIIAAILALLSVCVAGAQFAYQLDTPLAADSFRTGVEAYGRGRYAEALAQFERALASESDDPLCLYWLGKTYFRLGLDSAEIGRAHV